MILNQNILLSIGDYTHSGVISAGGTIGTAAYPVSNVLIPDLYTPMQLASNASQTFTVDLGGIFPIDLVAFIKHNIAPHGFVQVQISDDVGLVYDTGQINASPSLSTFGVLPWGSFTWGQTAPASQLANYNQHTIIPLPQTYYGRYVAYTINCPSNPALVTLARVWASSGYQPTFNADYGSGVIPIDQTLVFQASSGTRHYGQRVQRRACALNFSSLPQAEMMYNIVGSLMLNSGVSDPVICVLFPLDATTFGTQAVYGNMQAVQEIDYSSYGQMQSKSPIIIEEQV